MIIEDREMMEAWDRIARTPDGLLLYRYLQKECLLPAPNLDGSALPFFEGRRSLAFDMMANMSEGIADYDRTAVTFARARPGVAKSTNTDIRRAYLDQFKWNDAGTEPGAGSGRNGAGGASSTDGNT